MKEMVLRWGVYLAEEEKRCALRGCICTLHISICRMGLIEEEEMGNKREEESNTPYLSRWREVTMRRGMIMQPSSVNGMV